MREKERKREREREKQKVRKRREMKSKLKIPRIRASIVYAECFARGGKKEVKGVNFPMGSHLATFNRWELFFFPLSLSLSLIRGLLSRSNTGIPNQIFIRFSRALCSTCNHVILSCTSFFPRSASSVPYIRHFTISRFQFWKKFSSSFRLIFVQIKFHWSRERNDSYSTIFCIDLQS